MTDEGGGSGQTISRRARHAVPLQCLGIGILALLLADCGPSSPPPSALAARLSSAEARASGRRLYLAHCVLCHGERGDGQGVRHSSFARPPRDFTDAAWRRGTTPEQVFAAIRDGVHGTAMPSWKTLGEPAIADLTVYVLTVTRAEESAAGAPSKQ